MASPMNMNSFEGKRIVALVREGDYAHAGEEEAIERAFRSIPIPRLCRRRARRPAPLDFTSATCTRACTARSHKAESAEQLSTPARIDQVRR